jgi:hypothetical protein
MDFIRVARRSDVGLMSLEVATADAPEVPSHLVGNYYDATDDGDACLSVQTRVVSFGSSSNDSERGCGVDMRVVGVARSGRRSEPHVALRS